MNKICVKLLNGDLIELEKRKNKNEDSIKKEIASLLDVYWTQIVLFKEEEDDEKEIEKYFAIVKEKPTVELKKNRRKSYSNNFFWLKTAINDGIISHYLEYVRLVHNPQILSNPHPYVVEYIKNRYSELTKAYSFSKYMYMNPNDDVVDFFLEQSEKLNLDLYSYWDSLLQNQNPKMRSLQERYAWLQIRIFEDIPKTKTSSTSPGLEKIQQIEKSRKTLSFGQSLYIPPDFLENSEDECVDWFLKNLSIIEKYTKNPYKHFSKNGNQSIVEYLLCDVENRIVIPEIFQNPNPLAVEYSKKVISEYMKKGDYFDSFTDNILKNPNKDLIVWFWHTYPSSLFYYDEFEKLLAKTNDIEVMYE